MNGNPMAAMMAKSTGMAPNPRVQNAFAPLGPIKSKGCSAFDEAGIWSIGCEVVSDEAELAAARALHDELGPLIDGHNDLPWAMRGYAGYDLEKLDIAEDQSALQASGKADLQTDIPRLREGGVGGQFWSVFVPTPADPSPESPSNAVAVQQTLENIDFVHNMVAKYPETFHYCETADDSDTAFAAGKITSFIGMEGGCSIGNSLGVLRMMYRLGCRYMTLTHNGHLAWADSALTRQGTPAEPSAHGGLSGFGKEVVKEMNRLGMMVDLAHVSHGTMRAVLDASVSPVIFSHSNASSVCDHPRNVPDDVLDRIPANGGICMATFVAPFASWERHAWETEAKAGMGGAGATDANGVPIHPPRVLPSVVADHLSYMKDRIGAQHVGIGGDFDGCSTVGLTFCLNNVSYYPRLTAELVRRGWTKDELRGLFGQNIMRVLRANEAKARELQTSGGTANGTTIIEADGPGTTTDPSL
jgi:membrane dipeptidase